MSNYDEIRPRITGDALKKLREWEQIMWERYQTKVSPEKLVNMVLENIEFLDVQQTIKIGLKNVPPEDGTAPPKPKPRVIVRTSKFSSR